MRVILRKIIGYGEVSQERARLSVRYRCTHIKGLALIADLICHKLRHPNKIDQYNTRLAPLLKIKTTLGSNAAPLDNHWLAGFVQGDGSLALILSRQKNKSFKPTMYVHISQKKPDLLKLIQEKLGGSVGYRNSQDTYYYTSNSFTNAAKFIKYLDKHQLVGNKLAQYWTWRKAYLLYQEGTHLTDNEQLKLITLKSDLTKARAPKLDHLSLDEHNKRLQAKSVRAKNRKKKILKKKNLYD